MEKSIAKQKKEKVDLKISPEKALEILQEQELKKQEDCSKEVNEVLQKHGYGLSIRYEFVLTPIQK